MIFVVLSAMIFGLVHPGSKLILGQGIDLLSFCLLYVAIRLVVQIPVVIKTGHYRLTSRKQIITLAAIGVVGAALQMTEFMGIADGLPVPVVTFLVYTHPIWTLILGNRINGESITGTSVGKMALGIVGSAIISLGHLKGSIHAEFTQLLAPLFAGVMIALWVCLGAKAKKDGSSAWTVSFYYDLFALVALLSVKASGIIPSMSAPEMIGWLSEPKHLVTICIYSIFVGLLPNLLFYHGSQSISALSCGLILLLEPLVASVTSNIAWASPLPSFFLLGAGLVLLAGSPIESLPIRRLGATLQSTVATKIATVIFGLLLMIPSGAVGLVKSQVLHIVEIAPSEQSDYTVSKELRSIDLASDLAFKDFKKLRHRCAVTLKKDIARGTEQDLFSKVSGIAASASDSDMMVGMSRTSFARMAATAAKGSKLNAISIGAATANLSEINPQFFSIVSPWSFQWAVVKDRLKERGCAKERTSGFFDDTDYLSRNFKTEFEKQFGKDRVFPIRELGMDGVKTLADQNCLFVAVNFSKAQAPLSEIATKNLKLTILGIGDWNYYATELKVLLKNAPSGWRVSVPTGWTSAVSPESAKFERRFEGLIHEAPSPVAAYTYDATLVALHAMCDKLKVSQLNSRALKKMTLLRDYGGIADTNNFTSKMHLLEFKGERAL